MVVTEALARGIPVLAAAVGGLPETLDDAGFLVPPADPTALAAGLRRWFGEPELRDGLRRAAAHRRPELDGWEVTTRCLGTVMDHLRSGSPA